MNFTYSNTLKDGVCGGENGHGENLEGTVDHWMCKNTITFEDPAGSKGTRDLSCIIT